jgi:hypothetical protein
VVTVRKHSQAAATHWKADSDLTASHLVACGEKRQQHTFNPFKAALSPCYTEEVRALDTLQIAVSTNTFSSSSKLDTSTWICLNWESKNGGF